MDNMLVRIVRMEFNKDKVDDFIKMFNETYPQIRNFNGCRFLELYQDEQNASCYYTMSKWENEEALEKYRQSDLFKRTWAITKTYFGGPPVAYSLLKKVNDSTNPF